MAYDATDNVDIGEATKKAHWDQLLANDVALKALVDAVSTALLGDAAGRVLRAIRLQVEDGTNADTIKCITIDLWNGDAIGSTDNIGKGATVDEFTLDATGIELKIEAIGLTGNCVGVLSADKVFNSTNSALEAIGYEDDTNDIKLTFYNDTAGNGADLTAVLAGAEALQVQILYVTDA